MKRSDLDEIQRFLTTVDKPDLFAYLDVESDAEPAEIELALRRRRSWAQGQQANPKFRTEALWLIKNIEPVRTATLDEHSAYVADIRIQQQQQAIEALDQAVQDALVDGQLTDEAEAGILDHGARLGLPENLIRAGIEETLTAQDLGMAPIATEPPVPPEPSVNHYNTLGARPGDPFPSLEKAYRKRYRWARNLRDTEESSHIYAHLDEAWRVLKDADRRAQYDAEHGFPPPRSDQEDEPPSEETGEQPVEAERMGFLPPPEDAPSSDADAAGGDAPPEEPKEPDSAFAKPHFLDSDGPGLEVEDPAVEMDDPDASSDGASFDTGDVDSTEFEGDPPADAAGVQTEPVADDDPRSSETSADPEPSPATGDAADVADPLDLSNDVVTLDIGNIDDEAAPVLHVPGPKTHRIRTGNHPFPLQITVKNVGAGQMTGSVACELDWITISPSFLNPTRTEHKVEILVDPERMPGNSAQAVITIETDHGESQTITVDALKHMVSPLVVVVAALTLLGLTGLFGGIYFSGALGTAPVPPPRTILAVHVDPPAGEVYINDKLVGKQGTLSLVDSFPVDRPFQVRVELDGFEPWTKEVTVPYGLQIRVEADLVLRDPLDFTIDPTMRKAKIESKTVLHRLEQRQDGFKNCFTRHLQTETPYVASITAQCVVSSRGYVAAIRYQGANFESTPVQKCLNRQLRALKLPVIPGDYAVFEHTFRSRVGPPKMALHTDPSTPEQ